MLRISKLTDYATVIMSYLARTPHEIMSASQIAKNIHLSVPTVSKILKLLCEAKLIASFRGHEGGYQLAKPIHRISVADILVAIEGNVAMTECSVRKNLCALDKLCDIKENWQMINTVILKALSGLSLADMNTSLSHRKLKFAIPVKVETIHG